MQLEAIPVPRLRKRLQRKVRQVLLPFEGKRISLRTMEKARRTIKRTIRPYIRAGVLEHAWYSRLTNGEWQRKTL